MLMPGLANAITEHFSELSFSSSVCVNEMSQDSKKATAPGLSFPDDDKETLPYYFISISLVYCVGESSHL